MRDFVCLLSCFNPWLDVTCCCTDECGDEELACSLGSNQSTPVVHVSPSCNYPHQRVVRVNDVFHGAVAVCTELDGHRLAVCVLCQPEKNIPRGSQSFFKINDVCMCTPFFFSSTTM